MSNLVWTLVDRVGRWAAPQGGGGGGSIDQITSDDETVTISNPTGPTVDLSVTGDIGNAAPLAVADQIPSQDPVRLQDVADVGSLAIAARADHVHPSGRLIMTQSGTTYTLLLADGGTLIEFTSGSAVTLTIPPNSSVAFAIGDWVEVLQYGAGQVTCNGGVGVTRRSISSHTKTSGQYGVARLTKIGADEWVLTGDTA